MTFDYIRGMILVS